MFNLAEVLFEYLSPVPGVSGNKYEYFWTIVEKLGDLSAGLLL